jgi:Fe2+ or Zn2+ uptake regulation protein
MCSLSGSHNQMRLVGTVKRIVVVLRVLRALEQLSLEPKKSAADAVSKYLCLKKLVTNHHHIFFTKTNSSKEIQLCLSNDLSMILLKTS